MKKVISILSIVAIMLSTSITAFSGSIPEDLLHSDDAQIFFAEVINEYQPKGDKPYIEVLPVTGLTDYVAEDEKLPPLKNDSPIYLIMPLISRNTFYIFILPAVIGLILGICLWKVRKTYILSGVMLLGGVVWWIVLSQINTHGSEGPGLLALMYSLISVAFSVVEAIKLVVRKIKTRRR